MLKDILNGGQALRRQAAATIAAALGQIDEIRISSANATKSATDEVMKLQAACDHAQRVLPPNRERLYALAELEPLDMPASAANAAMPASLEIALDQLPPQPSPAASIGLGAAAGAVVGGALAFGLAWHGPLLGLALLPALLAGLAGAVLHGQRAIAVAAHYQDFADATRARAEQHALCMEQIRHGAAMSLQLTAHLERLALDRQSQLQAVASDTTIAAILLRDVLNTPLLNEEGAFIQEVIDQLHDQEQRVAKFKDRVALAAE